MIRFVDGEKPQKLINYVFSIKITKDPSGDKNDYIANPVQIFPKESCDQSILKSVQLFAFPDRAAIESQCFFTFVIGNPSTDFQLGFVSYYTYFDAYCVLSDYYYPDMFSHLLSLEKSEILSVCEEMGKEQIFDHSKKTDHFKIKDKDYPLDGGSERQQLTKLLFTTFPAYDISKIIIGMLSARHVFVVAGNASTCSLFAAALPILIEPFFWDLNLIPILPLKIIEMIDVPVPAMIGITRSELLQTDSIAPHICVNCDTKHVLDQPVFEQSNIALRLEVVRKQLDFHTQINALLNEWKQCPGFPHKLVLEKVMMFVSYYLQLYAGNCLSSADFLTNAKAKLPDFLLNSQIVNQLMILDDLDNKKKILFKKWFTTCFIKDAAEDLRKSNEIASGQTQKSDSNPSINIPLQQPQIQTNQNQPQVQQKPQQQLSLSQSQQQLPLSQSQQQISQSQQQIQQKTPQQSSQSQLSTFQSQLRATQPLQTQQPQRSSLGNAQGQPAPPNRNQPLTNPFANQPNSNPIPSKGTVNIQQQPPPPYLQKQQHPSASSSYNMPSPLSQRPPLNSSNIKTNTNPVQKPIDRNNAPSQNRPGYPLNKNQANRSYNEPSPLMNNSIFNSDSFKFNTSDSSPNNSLPNSQNLTLAQLSNVNNPNGDLFISFSSGGSTPSSSAVFNSQPLSPAPSSSPTTTTTTTTTAPNMNKNSTNFEIFNAFNQQKAQMRQNQMYQTPPQSNIAQPAQGLLNPFQTAPQYQQTQQYQSNQQIKQPQQYQQMQYQQCQQRPQSQKPQQNPQSLPKWGSGIPNYPPQNNQQYQQYPQNKLNPQFQQNQPFQQNQQFQQNQPFQQNQQFQQNQPFQQNQQFQQRQPQQQPQQQQQNLQNWTTGSQDYIQPKNNNNHY